MELIDYVGRTVLKNNDIWIKIGRIEDKIGVGVFNPNGSKIFVLWS